MKNLLFINAFVALLAFGCNNHAAKKDLRAKIDSLRLVINEKKARLHADSVFTGFMDLKWNSSKKEAVNLLKIKNELKINFISHDGDVMYLKGVFAGSDVKTLALTYYNDKLCSAWIDFGYKSETFSRALIAELELKYGKTYKTEKFCIWNFGISDLAKNKPEIRISDGSGGLSLSYDSKYFDAYEAERKEFRDNKEKGSINSKDL